MEDIYSKYSRNDSNSVLLKLLKETIVSPVLSPERIVIEHALLISLLHGNVGSEIGNQHREYGRKTFLFAVFSK